MTNDSSATVAVPEGAAEAVATAAASVAGVHALGSLLERASDSVRQRVGLATRAPGVKVDRARDGQVTAAVSIVVDYPHKLHEVSDAVRDAARGALGGLAAGPVDVDVLVTGVWGPFDTDPVDEAEAAVDEAVAATAEAADRVGSAVRDAGTAAGEALDEAADAVDARVRAVAESRETAGDAAVDGEPVAPVDGDTPARGASVDVDEPISDVRDGEARDPEELVADALDEIADSVARAADDVRDRAPDERG